MGGCTSTQNTPSNKFKTKIEKHSTTSDNDYKLDIIGPSEKWS